ncbi:MAG: zinc ribbon domain-containing protein [Clostridiales bacterium]|nr:zinc ribbon domain-containing protein [Clostridiales bacterium]
MDTIQNYKCPCCGAPLVFDGKSQELKCQSCRNTFSMETMEQMTGAEQAAKGESKFDWEHYEPRSFEDNGGVELSDYSCPSCGAQITGDDTMGATVCPYCGNSTIVKGQFEGTLRPDYIIPFKVDKKTAMTAFEEDFKKAPFLPDEFKSKKKIEEMAGVYVPFWMFDCDCNAAISYRAQLVTHWSDSDYNYIKTDYFKLFRSGSVGFANIPVDGSKKADDAYMEAVEPFDYSAAVEFNSAYLSGYLADKYDVTAQESVVRANERVKNSTVSVFESTTGGYVSVTPENSSISFSNGKIRYSLLPVWMLNIKYNNTMYKFAINGQTGKVVGEYPVDKSKKRRFFAKVLGISYVAAAILAYLLLR